MWSGCCFCLRTAANWERAEASAFYSETPQTIGVRWWNAVGGLRLVLEIARHLAFPSRPRLRLATSPTTYQDRGQSRDPSYIGPGEAVRRGGIVSLKPGTSGIPRKVWSQLPSGRPLDGASCGRPVYTLAASGRVNQKTEPWPSSLSTPTLPPYASTTSLTMASPRPAPPSERERDLSTR